jgi:hypothetical protein
MYKLVKVGGTAGDSLYDAAATYGRIKTTITSVIAAILGFVALYFGYFKMKTPEVHTETVRAVVITPNCVTNTQYTSKGTRRTINCSLEVNYTVNDKVYKKMIEKTGHNYIAGESIELRYNPQDPSDVTTSLTNRTLGLLIMGGGLLMIVVAWASWYITRKSKFGASMVAANDAINIFRD